MLARVQAESYAYGLFDSVLCHYEMIKDTIIADLNTSLHNRSKIEA